jgi:polysaccharide export outer membrane protein
MTHRNQERGLVPQDHRINQEAKRSRVLTVISRREHRVAQLMLMLMMLLGVPAVSTGAEQGETYALQPGDQLNISVLQDPSLNQSGVVITPDGTISFPLAGQVHAAGMSIRALERELTRRLSKNYKTPPTVTVMLSEVNPSTSSQVYITGEVNKPGPYPITPGLSVMQALALSGGLGKFAAKSRIQIHRRTGGTEEVLLFNYSDFESGRNLQQDVTLQPGDVIVVPQRGLFF